MSELLMLPGTKKVPLLTQYAATNTEAQMLIKIAQECQRWIHETGYVFRFNTENDTVEKEIIPNA